MVKAYSLLENYTRPNKPTMLQTNPKIIDRLPWKKREK